MKNLKSILTGFNKTLTKLEALTKQNTKQVEVNTTRIDELKQQNLDLTAEAQAAKNIAQNIRQLITAEATVEETK
ncbi:hypothetical protein [Oceanisphaera psychrotolerans]|uniref:Uncharacterized protein n=1 Tax=Oceanisphaera psychrotolerans TaxID=1414654 RepID=A0A1J4QBQ4_9GAMM|nr:hypothetical protein [Oceanisphaera psychrotolerans]OIN07925.1 hypothetical protein BFR47_16030 [Oceanisphaera psychrotolerans]